MRHIIEAMPIPLIKDFTILYGSQTGQAEAISEELFDRSFKEGFNPVRFCLSKIEKKFSLEKEKYIVIVCSTTGEGEPPDTALKFVRRIKKKTLSSRHLQHLSFALLGLGDSNYTNFCNCAKTIVTRLTDLGATNFYETGFGDDAVGLEDVVEPWIDGLFPALHKLLKTDSNIINLNNTINTLLTANIEDREVPAITSLPSSEPLMAESTCTEEGTEEEVKATIISSVPPLCVSALKVPSSPSPYLQINFNNELQEVDGNSFEYPSACTAVKYVCITSTRQLTFDSSVKKALELELNIEGVEFDYEPGDSFGIICENRKEDVDYLLNRLDIDNIADKLMTLEIMSDTLKKAPSIPQHIHCPSTIRKIFTQYVDFRAVPRKAMIRMLVDYTENDAEKRRLQELCSVQGGKDYSAFVREDYIGLIQLLQVFHSCKPHVSRVLEFLPQLLPREYSVASYSHKKMNHLKFVFNIIDLPEFQSTKRFGLCTNWLDSVTAAMRETSNKSFEENIASLNLEDNKVKIYFRRPTPFRFPEDLSQPLIMIGPGTGVAPFIGFLQKREYLKGNDPSLELGSAVLFYGCRYREKDFLYRDELLAFKESKVLTELYTSYSRDENNEPHVKYVQDVIRKQKQLVLQLLFEKNGAVFICGDAKHMGRDVTNTFVDLIEEYKNVSKMDAIKIINELRKEKQFLEDVWT